MLGGIQAGLAALDGYDHAALAAADPDLLAREIGTLFAQFERLVQSTREFYTYLTQVLSRFDLDRGEFQAFKSALLDYLQRFVDEISRYMPQIADILGRLAPRVSFLCERANAGQRLLDIDGQAARRCPAGVDLRWLVHTEMTRAGQAVRGCPLSVACTGRSRRRNAAGSPATHS